MAEREPTERKTNTRRVTPRQRLAVAGGARGNSISEGAVDAGVRSRETLYRWMSWPEFQAAVEQHKADRADAVQAVRGLVRSAEVPALVRLKAVVELYRMTT